MPIDFSTYAPSTVLRVRCRDGKDAYLHVGFMSFSETPHLLIRDDCTDRLNHRGLCGYDNPSVTDVVRILGEMVMKTN